MKNIEDILEQMHNLEKRLSVEIQKKQESFFYKIQGGKIKFEELKYKRMDSGQWLIYDTIG